MNDAAGPAPLDLSALRGTLDSLASGLSVSGAPAFDAQPAAWGNLLRAGLIQHFEFCFELGVRMIKRQLERETEDRAKADRVLSACQPLLQHGQALLACLATRNRG